MRKLLVIVGVVLMLAVFALPVQSSVEYNQAGQTQVDGDETKTNDAKADANADTKADVKAGNKDKADCKPAEKAACKSAQKSGCSKGKSGCAKK